MRASEETARADADMTAGVKRYYDVGLFEVTSQGPVSGLTDTVGGVTDDLLWGGEEEQERQQRADAHTSYPWRTDGTLERPDAALR